MPSRKRGNGEGDLSPERPVSLKRLAEHLGLSPTTLSLVLNNSPGASAIPRETQERIFAAAERFEYRPNPIARSLRSQRSYTLGVLVPEMSDGYSAMVLGGIEGFLLRESYFYFIGSHRHKAELIEQYTRLFVDRCVEGIIFVDTPVRRPLRLPVVSVSGHERVEGLTNIVLDHQRAAELALEYLVGLGHRRIAVIKGQDFSSDTEVRWSAIRATAEALGVPIHPGLVAQLVGDDPSPEPGYLATKALVASGLPFTAVFAFNDISAIGAIRTLREAGYRVPEDVSVVGFDDTFGAAFHNPALTTIRQPLRPMGALAAEWVLRRISDGPSAPFPDEVEVEPELVVRQSTAEAPQAIALVSASKKP
jgi:DNA-binding LacI/PurR family transcriptional regulator